MIVVVGANGIAAWSMRLAQGHARQLVCINDNFAIDIPHIQPRAPRQILNQMRIHSEQLNGQTVSISEISIFS
jgi:hypothetical protein